MFRLGRGWKGWESDGKDGQNSWQEMDSGKNREEWMRLVEHDKIRKWGVGGSVSGLGPIVSIHWRGNKRRDSRERKKSQTKELRAIT